MRFKDSLWDDSDPDYAPCLKKIRGTYYWMPPKKYKDAGYAIRTYRLDGPSEDRPTLEQAAHCRVLTREMLEWYEGETGGGRQAGTWGWLIGRYIHDEYSPIRGVQPSTREKYIKELARIEEAIGEVLLSETDYSRLMQWQITMRDKGRSVSYISKWFRHWGLALSHGCRLENKDCVRIKTIRNEMRIQAPASRQDFITRDQVNAIVQEADRRGWWQLSLSVLIRFEFILRGVDVYGEWEPDEDRLGGITYHGRRWVKGITWEMIDPDVTRLTKTISKTARSLPEPYTFDLTYVPEVRDRMLAIAKDERVGPLIKMEDGLPPRNDRMTRQFRTVVDHLKLPRNLQIRDNRSGGITEAKNVDPYLLRDAAQHTQLNTTDRYVRGRSDAANKVVQIRRKK